MPTDGRSIIQQIIRLELNRVGLGELKYLAIEELSKLFEIDFIPAEEGNPNLVPNTNNPNWQLVTDCMKKNADLFNL